MERLSGNATATMWVDVMASRMAALLDNWMDFAMAGWMVGLKDLWWAALSDETMGALLAVLKVLD